MKKERGLFKKIKDWWSDAEGKKEREEEEQILREAESAERRGNYKKARMLYYSIDDFEKVGDMSVKLGQDETAIDFYEHYKIYDRYFSEPLHILPSPQKAAELYQKRGDLGLAFDRYANYSGPEYADRAGELAEKIYDYKSAIRMYKKNLRWRKRFAKTDPEKIEELSKKISIVERKLKRRESRRKDLTSRLSLLIIALIEFIISVLFLSPNITGNAINNLEKFDSNIIGAVLFMGGLIVTIFWIKKR